MSSFKNLNTDEENVTLPQTLDRFQNTTSYHADMRNPKESRGPKSAPKRADCDLL